LHQPRTPLWPCLALALCLAASPARAAADEDDFSIPVHDFSLTERSGRTVTRDDLLGKVWVASFVVTRCPDGKCPQVARTLQRLQKELAGRRDLLLVTFTTDPTRDDPDELKRYADAHGADPDRWLFLTGSEEEIDRLMQSFLLRKPGADFQKGRIDHSQKLVLVDRRGNARGYFDGLEDPYAPEGYFENNLRRLRREADRLLAPKLPAWLPKDFPAFNAALNAASAALLLIGYSAIRRRRVRLHAACMLSALVVSAVFLTSYLFYHLVVKEGRPTRFADQAPGAPEWVAYLYLAILGSHTLLAVPAAPMALATAYLGLRGRLGGHVRLARWALPVWLYVSLTGVVVYWMLYRLYPPP
jgi:uncharacterized membrane protein YozB (DUF420 family)/cytochrome oxidase Cu insertion factor (SCO1/SenC/PrrC family)